MNYEIFDSIADLRRSGTVFVLVTIVEATGSVPGKPGARMVVLPEETFGTIGGGAMEHEAISHARGLFKTHRNEVVHYNLDDLEMTCGGKTTVQYEYIAPPRRLFIFGGGHIGSALAAMAPNAGFDTTVFDNRTDIPLEGRFPEAVKTILGPYEEAVNHLQKGSYVVVLTHGHQWDEAVLKAMGPELLAGMKYIGVIGSRAKTGTMHRNLEEAGSPLGANFFMPIGLAIGGPAPGDIAVSILAELIGVFHETTNLPHLRHPPPPEQSDPGVPFFENRFSCRLDMIDIPLILLGMSK